MGKAVSQSVQCESSPVNNPECLSTADPTGKPSVRRPGGNFNRFRRILAFEKTRELLFKTKQHLGELRGCQLQSVEGGGR